MDNIQLTEYQQWLSSIEDRVRQVQQHIVRTANTSLILFYWEIGQQIAEKQQQSQWGDKVLEQLSKDLKTAFPDLTGFSVRNLKYARSFFAFYEKTIGQQAVAQLQQLPMFQIPWSHNIRIFTKTGTYDEALFYLVQTIENGWSRDTLALQLKSNLYERQGKAISNFNSTLPAPQSDLAQQITKDPYVFDFMTLANDFREKDIERQLVEHVSKFLLELGKGFAFLGTQYHLEIADNDYYLDMLFYHVTLKCYVVVELKNTAFKPEYAGKLNFYLSAVDTLLKKDNDTPTIGIMLCRDKNNIEAEFALRDLNKPMGISEFQFAEVLPDNLKASLPSIEEIEQGLKLMDND